MLNQFFKLTKKTHILCSENEDVKPKIGLYIVHKCAENIPQMMKWDTPKGEMGYPNWQNGTSQMGKWDIIKGGLGASGHG